MSCALAARRGRRYKPGPCRSHPHCFELLTERGRRDTQNRSGDLRAHVVRSCRAPRPPIQAWPMSVGALSQKAPFAARAQPRAPAPSAGGPVRPVRLGPLALPNRYFLAPLAGVSDWPFRLLCREMGAAIAHTEMISSHGLVHGGDQTLTYLERPATERPFAIQVFGHDPDVLAEGARVAVEQSGPVDAVDINMDCRVKKVSG